MKKTTLKRSQKPLKKVSPRKKTNPLDKKKQKEEDIKFYQEVWEERKHYSDLTGKYIPGEIMSIYFHHLLRKETYPEFRHKKWNIVLIEADIHAQIEMNPDKLSDEIYNRLQNFEVTARMKANLTDAYCY